MHTVVRIGTRGSQLALWQARTVAQALEATGTAAELVIIRTTGDHLQDAPVSEGGGKRLFVKEIEDALLREDVDIAVHSAKDMPAVLPEGLEVAATLPREDPRDVIVLPQGATGRDAAAVFAQLGSTPRIGTSSVRRTAQLASAIPGAAFVPIRGNVDTRLRKLDRGEYDALVLAAAGIRRLGFADRISAAIPPEDCVPAPGQGIVAIEIRANDDAARTVLQRVHHTDSASALAAERAVVAALGGGCQLPLGALAVQRHGTLHLQAIVCSADGARSVRARDSGPIEDPVGLGTRVAERLTSEGAAEILDEVRRNSDE
jgi:hydroxymethylbilane synthase